MATDPRLTNLARTTNDALADASIRHAIFLERYKTHVVNGVVGSLNPAYDRLIDRTFSVLSRFQTRGGEVRIKDYATLRKLVEDTTAILADAYRDAVRDLRAELTAFAQQEAAWQIDQINRASPIEFALRTPDPGVFRAIVTGEPFGDQTREVVRTLNEWFTKAAGDAATQVRSAIEVGLRQGDTVDAVVRRVRGTASLRFRDGAVGRARQYVATWVRTASSNTSALTREAVARENEEVVEGLQYLATLDSRTCFPAGTMVTLWGGERAPIETLSPGDYVVSGSGKRRRVNALVEKTGRDWRTIVLSNGERIRATSTHLFWCGREGGSWVAAQDIREGDAIGTRPPKKADACDLQSLRRGVRVLHFDAEEVLLARVLLRGSSVAGQDVPMVRQAVQGAGLLRAPGRWAGELLREPVQECRAQGRIAAGCDHGHMRDLWQGVPVWEEQPRQGRAQEALLESVQLPAGHKGLRDLRANIRGGEGPDARTILLGGLLPLLEGRDLAGAHGARGDRGGRSAVRAGGADGAELHRLRGGGLARHRGGRDLLAQGQECPATGHAPQGQEDRRCGVHAAAVRGAAGQPGGSGAVQGRACHGNAPEAQGWAVVVAVEADRSVEPCYDIEVEADHCFLVGASGVIAHNTETCATLDGQVFRIGDGPRPPMHPNCRSTMTYVLKSWKQLGIPLKEAPPGTRESLNGQVPQDVTFPKWFERQPAAFQREYLGPGRYDLWKSGQVEFRGLVDNQNRPLSLRDLERRAGLEAA